MKSKIQHLIIAAIVMLVSLTAGGAMCWFDATHSVVIDEKILAEGIDTPDNFEITTSGVDLFLSSEGNSAISFADESLSNGTTSHIFSAIGGQLSQIAKSVAVFIRTNIFPLHHRHTLYYIFALHHLRD